MKARRWEKRAVTYSSGGAVRLVVWFAKGLQEAALGKGVVAVISILR